MGLNASKAAGNNSNFKKEILEAGVYPARLVQLIDLGLQPQKPFNGKEKAPMQEVMFTYEFSDEFMHDEDGNEIEDKPRWLSETLPLYNLFADKAKTTQRYNAMDPDGAMGGDFSKLIGVPVNVTVVINEGSGKNAGKFYENVAGLAPMRKREADKLPELVNPSKLFDLDDPDIEVFQALPEWVQKKIKDNLEYKGSKLEALVAKLPEDKEDKKEEKPNKKAKKASVEEDDEPPF